MKHNQKVGLRRRVLGVVVVTELMALIVVAVVVVPQYTCACNGDAKGSNLTTNLQSIRAQLELYRLQHDGKYPTDITAQLTEKTDIDGKLTRSGQFGPYMQRFPANPFVHDQDEAIKTSGAPRDGWFYEAETGAFFANTYGHKDL